MADLKSVTLTWDDEDRPVVTVTYADADRDGSGMRADPDEWLNRLAAQASDNGVRFLSEMLRINDEREAVSLAGLAEDIGVEKRVVDGWNRNLGRSVKAVVRDNGFLRPDAEDGTAQLFDYIWDQPNNQWLYVIPKPFRGTLSRALGERSGNVVAG